MTKSWSRDCIGMISTVTHVYYGGTLSIEVELEVPRRFLHRFQQTIAQMNRMILTNNGQEKRYKAEQTPWRCCRGICFADPPGSRVFCFADLPISEPRTYQVVLDSKDCVYIFELVLNISSWPGYGAVACRFVFL